MIDLDVELANTFKISKKTQDEFDISITFPKSLSYFEGHFPQFPVLPAVALVDVSFYFARLRNLGLPKFQLKKVDYLKIKSPLGPGQEIKIDYSKKSSNSYEATWKLADGTEIAEINFAFEC